MALVVSWSRRDLRLLAPHLSDHGNPSSELVNLALLLIQLFLVPIDLPCMSSLQSNEALDGGSVTALESLDVFRELAVGILHQSQLCPMLVKPVTGHRLQGFDSVLHGGGVAVALLLVPRKRFLQKAMLPVTGSPIAFETVAEDIDLLVSHGQLLRVPVCRVVDGCLNVADALRQTGVMHAGLPDAFQVLGVLAHHRIMLGMRDL
mmetsp:Transcript_45789/g.130710  ORF Transcript_45789/g.130710 Transcript_45789/m.130710 type:complete len:205 (+) Transcript_45789:54-668(+)